MCNLSNRPQNKNFGSRMSKTNTQRAVQNRLNYNTNPKHCKHCNSVIPYEKKQNVFCNHSCKATYNNNARTTTTKHKIIIIKCPECSISFEKSIHNSRTICNHCYLAQCLDNNKRIKDKNIKSIFSYVTFSKCEECPTIYRKKSSSHKKCVNCSITYRDGYRHAATFDFKQLAKTKVYNLELVKQYGWYSKNNTNGVTYDHLYRVIDGYKNNIPPEVLKHPANAEMVTWNENRKRQHKSTITLEELYRRIEEW